MHPSFVAKTNRLGKRLNPGSERQIRLRKSTSNLFRARSRGSVHGLDLSDFQHVLGVDPTRLEVEVEGLTTYENLVDATLPFNCMPQVVPELKTITIGGALAGGGIESSSFRFGFVHETINEIEILLADGTTVVATPDNEHRDLFFGFPNSYGTLGYAVRIRARLAEVKPYVRLRHHHFCALEDYFAAIDQHCRSKADFVDGTVFDRDHFVVSVGTMVAQAPELSDYTWMKPYYRSVQGLTRDDLTIHDYLWRWDADWFWCSRVFGMQRPALRFLFGKLMLNSRRYSQLMAIEQRCGLGRRLGWAARRESVIQDVQIPLPHASSFLHFMLQEVPILPIWICPARSPESRFLYPLYETDPSALYINFGFWGAVPGKQSDASYNRRIEDMVAKLDGKKSLYSSSYYSAEEFGQQYNQVVYQELKARYDPAGVLGTMYEKCVLGQ